MKIGVVSVVFIANQEQLKIAQDSLKSIHSSEHDVIHVGVVNKWFPEAKSQLNYDFLIINDHNCLARAWNKGINKAFNEGCDYAVVINLDILAHTQCIDNLIRTANNHPDPLIFCASVYGIKESLHTVIPPEGIDSNLENNSFSFFMLDKRLFELVGQFDERFKPAYFEDWEMRDRVRIAGYEIVRDRSALFWHYHNITRKLDKRAEKYVNRAYRKNQQLYRKIAKLRGITY